MHEFLERIEKSLPPLQVKHLRSEPDCYGASRIISDALGLPFRPYSFASWYHGWLSWDVKYVETFGIAHPWRKLVATSAHQRFLSDHGVDAVAVGAPFVYAFESIGDTIVRQPNSLLVMPPHSIQHYKESWDEEAYIKKIKLLSSDFDYIVACVSPSCVSQNVWIHTLEKYDIPYIVGANMHDSNGLLRMCSILKSFEYVTTNRVGGHVVYAAYSGCKVSIFGDYLNLESSEFDGDELYIEHPHLVTNVIDELSKKSVCSKFPFLFVHPKKASKKVQWASEQLGEGSMKSFFKLSWYLGWWPHQQIYYLSLRIIRKLKKEISLFFK
jgi:hypothetical protein